MTDPIDDADVIVTTARPAPATTPQKPRPRKQPQYSVIVLNDDVHTYPYVIEVLSKVCGHSLEQSYRLAVQIDTLGLAAVWTGTRELAELKRDQILGYGRDPYAQRPATFPLGCYVAPAV